MAAGVECWQGQWRDAVITRTLAHSLSPYPAAAAAAAVEATKFQAFNSAVHKLKAVKAEAELREELVRGRGRGREGVGWLG